jgi:hypothetical protein
MHRQMQRGYENATVEREIAGGMGRGEGKGEYETG